jgi:hypothetical protein
MNMGRPVVILAIAVLFAIGYPYLELAWKCRPSEVHSEACVWGRSYFSLSRWVEPVIIAPIAWAVMMVVSRLFAGGKPSA